MAERGQAPTTMATVTSSSAQTSVGTVGRPSSNRWIRAVMRSLPSLRIDDTAALLRSSVRARSSAPVMPSAAASVTGDR